MVSRPPHRTAVTAILLLLLPATAHAVCPTIFYARAIDLSFAQPMEFYFTKVGVPSVAECANFCANKQLCRSAVYNFDSQTCALSPDYRVDCTEERKRFNGFYSTSAEPLAFIGCIDRCKKGDRKAVLEPLFVVEEGVQAFQKRGHSFNPKFNLNIGPETARTPETSTKEPMDFASAAPVAVVTADPEGRVASGDRKEVHMHARPLSVESVTEHAATTDAEAEERSVVQRTENGTASKHESGSFVAGLPGGNVSLLTMGAEEFAKLTSPDLKTLHTHGKVQVEGGDLERVIQTIKQQLDTLKEKAEPSAASSSPTTPPSTSTSSASAAASRDVVVTKRPTLLLPATTTEPIVVNGKVLSPEAAAKLLDFERTSTTTTTTPRPLALTTEEEGFMNTFVIRGLGDMFREAAADERRLGHGHVAPQLSTDAVVPEPVCFRIIPQQNLQRAAYTTLPGRVSLTECRCACARTWESDAVARKCKSLQFNELAGQCTLNRDDHHGKFDLVLNKTVDYHFITCDQGTLLDMAGGQCESAPASSSGGGADLVTVPMPVLVTEAEAIKKPSTTTTTTTPTSTTTTPIAKQRPGHFDKESAEIVKDDVNEASSPVHSVTMAKPDTHAPNNKLVQANVTERVDVVFSTSTTTPTPSTASVTPKSTTATASTEENEMFTSPVPKATHKPHPKPKDPKKVVKKPVQRPPVTKPSSTEPPTTTSESTTTTPTPTTTTTTTEESTTRPATTTTTTTPIPITTTTIFTTTPPPTTTTTVVQLITAAEVQPAPQTEPCFEAIAGFKLTSMPGGLESDVSLEECQCFCANSKISNRYKFQCLSAMYYHNERDCVLFLDNRQMHPREFIKAPKSDGAVTYIGMTCPLSKTLEQHVNPSLAFGCLRPTSTTSAPRTTTTAVHTDDCFNEQPHFTLEGDYIGVERNVSVDECKCFCIDSETRYGGYCQSIQYYYDSQTCLLSKENQISDPENFVYDPYSTQLRSYFDYTCRTEKTVLSVYVESVCRTIVDVDLKSLGLTEIKPPSLRPETSASNNDDASEEVKSDPATSAELQSNSLKLLKPLPPTTSTSTTTTSTTTEPTTTTTEEPSSTTPATTPAPPPTASVKRGKLSRIADVEELSESEEAEARRPSSATTTPTPTTTTTGYKPVGQCNYSALYQTIFNGSRMLKRVIVTSPAQCFAACHAEKCRSANLIQMDGIMKSCELYRDSLVDFRRTDVLSFDAAAVHFDAIRCEEA